MFYALGDVLTSDGIIHQYPSRGNRCAMAGSNKSSSGIFGSDISSIIEKEKLMQAPWENLEAQKPHS